MDDENLSDLCDSTHPGFAVTCKKCGSTEVYVENTLGFSGTSGVWGSVNLTCRKCENSVEIVSP